MGNCGNCVHRRPRPVQRRPSINSSSSTDTYTRSLHRNVFTNRFSNLRNLSSYNLYSLIDETLLIIRTVVDTDQDPPHAMLVLSRIANREDRWLEVMAALVERVPMNDPLGATVIALLLDECLLPTKELLHQLIKRICANNQPRMKALHAIVDEQVKHVTQQSNSTGVECRPGHASREIAVDPEETVPAIDHSTPETAGDQQSTDRYVGFLQSLPS